MVKTTQAENLDLIQSEVHEDLLEYGFKRRSRTFNKLFDSGLIHVINFQMGRRSLSGKFTINLGIYVPEIYTLIWSEDPPKFVDHGHCELNKRLGELLDPPIDLWWDLNLSPKKISKIVLSHIHEHALPYLNRFITPNDIIREWSEHGIDIGLPPRANLSIAILLVNDGEYEQARNLMKNEIARKKNEPYSEFVVEIAQKLGLRLSVD